MRIRRCIVNANHHVKWLLSFRQERRKKVAEFLCFVARFRFMLSIPLDFSPNFSFNTLALGGPLGGLNRENGAIPLRNRRCNRGLKLHTPLSMDGKAQ
jgi:hypothetical protein